MSGRNDSTETMMRLLAAHVPVTLLLDLASPPDARELYRREGGRPEPPPIA